MADEPTFFLVVIGWDANKLLVHSNLPGTAANLLSSSLVTQGGGCTNCTGGKRVVEQVGGPVFIDTDAKEMYVLEFAREADAKAWINSDPNSFLGKQLYGYTRNWAKP